MRLYAKKGVTIRSERLALGETRVIVKDFTRFRVKNPYMWGRTGVLIPYVGVTHRGRRVRERVYKRIDRGVEGGHVSQWSSENDEPS